jgi:hypothetical protein
MPELAHKINAAKWRQVNLEETNDVSADAITSLRTRMNALSLWEIESDEQFDQAALAIAAAGDFLETFDLVPLYPTSLIDTGLELEKSRGNTKVEDLKNTHFDIVHLTYARLGIMANHIVQSFRNNKVKRYTRDDLIGLLNNAIENGRLKKEDLSISISQDL